MNNLEQLKRGFNPACPSWLHNVVFMKKPFFPILFVVLIIFSVLWKVIGKVEDSDNILMKVTGYVSFIYVVMVAITFVLILIDNIRIAKICNENGYTTEQWNEIKI